MIRMRGKPCPSDPVSQQALRRNRRTWTGKDSANGAAVLALWPGRPNRNTVRLSSIEKPPQIIRRGQYYRRRSNAKAEAQLRRYDGCCRKVWNLAVAEQQRRHVQMAQCAEARPCAGIAQGSVSVRVSECDQRSRCCVPALLQEVGRLSEVQAPWRTDRLA